MKVTTIRWSRRWAAAAIAAGLLTLVACGGDDGSGADGERPALDLMNLQAETDTGIIDVIPVENAFVGRVDDETFAAIAIGDPDDDGERMVTAYVCDDHYGVWLRGPMNDDGFTALGSFEEGAYLEFTHDGTSEEIVGIVTVGSLVRRTFTTTAAEEIGRAHV